MGSLSPVKSEKLHYTIRFPPVFGSCNSKMLLVKSWDNMDPFLKNHDSLSSKSYLYYHISFLLTFSQNVTRVFFVTIALTSKLQNLIDFTIEKLFISCFFQIGLIETWNKKYFSSLIIHEKKYYFLIFYVRYTAIIFQKY